jgi:outer membrane biosynthesis protein TonB
VVRGSGLTGVAASSLRTDAGDRIESTRGFRAGRSAEGTGSEANRSTARGFGVKSASAAWRALVVRSREPERPRARASVATPMSSRFAAVPSVRAAGTQYPVAQSSAASLGPAPVPGPDATASYRVMISAWLESHKHYPESARERGEEGIAALRFRIDRSGHRSSPRGW